METGDETLSHEDFERLCKLRADARLSEDNFLREAQNAKDAKKRMEAAQLRVNRFLDEMASGPLPLERQIAANITAETQPPISGADDAPTSETIPVREDGTDYDVLPDEDRWRFVSIDELLTHGVGKGMLTRLKGAGIHTVGDLAEFSDADKDLTDIKGIGDNAKDEIINAMIGYFQANPIPKPEKPLEPRQNDSPGQNDESYRDVPEEGVERQPEPLKTKPKRRRTSKSAPDLPFAENASTEGASFPSQPGSMDAANDDDPTVWKQDAE